MTDREGIGMTGGSLIRVIVVIKGIVVMKWCWELNVKRDGRIHSQLHLAGSVTSQRDSDVIDDLTGSVTSQQGQ